MGFLTRLKAALSPARYLSSTVREMEGWGIRGSKHRPFDAERAIRAFNHWAYAAAMMNANAVASVPLRLYARVRPGKKKNFDTRPLRGYMKDCFAGKTGVTLAGKVTAQKAAEFGSDIEEVVETHPALSVLQKVNPWQNGYELTELRILDQQVTGNAYFHIVLDSEMEFGGVNYPPIPNEIWRMPPQWTRVIPSPQNFINGYLYGQSTDVEKVYPPDEVIHFKMPNMADTHYGRGWFEACWRALGLHEAKREMDTARADNYARPDYAVVLKGNNSPEKLDAFDEKLKEKFEGIKKSGKPIVINGDAELTPLNFDEKEYGTPTRLIEEIAAGSGVPITMLLSNDPNKANSESGRLAWYRGTILGYCTRDAEKLNEQLLPKFGEAAEDLMYCYDHVCFEDRAALVKEQVGLVAGGIRTANEARSWLGDAPSDDPSANRLYPPSGNAGTSGVAGDTAVNQNNDRQND